MAVQYSIQKMVSDGTLSTIILGIQYLQRNDIYVRIAGEDTPQSGAPSGYTWSFINNTTLKVLPVVPSGVEVIVYRRTDINSMYNVYSQNAQFDEATIDENNQQLLYIAQEYLEQGLPGAGVDTIEFLRDDGINTYYRIRRTDGSYSEEFAVPSVGSSARVVAREALRRACAEAGLILVLGSFEVGFTLTGAFDAALHEGTGKVYSGSSGTYPPNTSVSSFTDRSDVLLRGTLGIRVIDFLPLGHVKDGSVDYTAQCQAAIDAASTLAVWLEWPDFPIGVSTPSQIVPPEQHPYVLLARNNTLWKNQANLKLLPQATAGYSVIRIRDVDNVYLHKPKVHGDKATHTGVGGEWGYGIEVGSGASNVEIFEPETSDCWGDGIYIGLVWGETRPDVHPKNITIVRPKDTGARRNSISLTSGVNVVIHHPEANDVNAVAPSAAIDVEPENKSGVGFTKPRISRSRIIGGVANNCVVGLDIPIFLDYEVDLVHEGTYVCTGCPIPYSFLSPAMPSGGAVSTIVLGELTADSGVINISLHGCHNFDIKSLLFKNNNPVLTVTNQAAPASQALIMGLKIRGIVYKDGLIKQLGLLTDSLGSVNLPVVVGDLALSSDTYGFAYVFLDTNMANAVFSERASIGFLSKIQGVGSQELISRFAGDKVEFGGAPGYATSTYYVNLDRRKLKVSSAPALFSATGRSVVITSQTGATFFYNATGGGVSSGPSVTLTTRQSAEINWIPGSDDYIVRVV